MSDGRARDCPTRYAGGVANETLRAAQYRRRVVDAELDELLTGAGAISLEGAKGVGKSATAAERVDAEFRLESPVVRTLVEADPSRLLGGRRVLLDAWQHLPFTWDLVRRAVDAGASARPVPAHRVGVAGRPRPTLGRRSYPADEDAAARPVRTRL